MTQTAAVSAFESNLVREKGLASERGCGAIVSMFFAKISLPARLCLLSIMFVLSTAPAMAVVRDLRIDVPAAVVAEAAGDLLAEAAVDRIELGADVVDDVARVQLLVAAVAGEQHLPQVGQDAGDGLPTGQRFEAQVVQPAAGRVRLDQLVGDGLQSRLAQPGVGGHGRWLAAGRYLYLTQSAGPPVQVEQAVGLSTPP